MNLYEIFADTAKHQPGQPAVIGPDPGAAISYGDLKDRIDRIADQLKNEGITPGACAGLHWSSGREYLILTYALWRCGACVVPIATELADAEKRHIIREIHIDCVVSDSNGGQVWADYQRGESKALANGVVISPIASPRVHPEAFPSVNAAFLRFTSGTTGDSKGVVLSHETIFDRIHAANEFLEIGPGDRVVTTLSMSYHFAVSIVSYLSFGATIILCRNHLGSTICNSVLENKATIIYGAPAHYALMASDPGASPMPSLRLAVSTTTALRNDIATRFYDRFNIPLSQCYGIIELGLPSINDKASIEKCGSVGKALPAYRIRLDDMDENGVGKIKIKGKGFLDAYYEPWRTRDEITENGWFATGDLGRLDAEGYLFIVGRSKEVISVAGMKFFPQEVESVLESHNAIREAYVFGEHNDLLGEKPNAKEILHGEVKETPSENALRDFCRARLAAYKVPDRIFFVDRLAKTASGKLVRHS